MKREINLSPEQVKAILTKAKEASLRDYLLLKTLTVGDFRVGEVVGSAGRRWIKHEFKDMRDQVNPGSPVNPKWFSQGHWEKMDAPNLPGLQIEDLRQDGIWVQGKGWKKEKNPAPPKLVPLPLELIKDLRNFVGARKTGRIFEVSEGRVWQLTRFYAQKAGVADWKMVHPHRFRHYTTTQVARKHGVLAARDIARHANISTTNRYISELDPEEKRKIIQAQEDLISV